MADYPHPTPQVDHTSTTMAPDTPQPQPDTEPNDPTPTVDTTISASSTTMTNDTPQPQPDTEPNDRPPTVDTNISASNTKNDNEVIDSQAPALATTQSSTTLPQDDPNYTSDYTGPGTEGIDYQICIVPSCRKRKTLSSFRNPKFNVPLKQCRTCRAARGYTDGTQADRLARHKVKNAMRRAPKATAKQEEEQEGEEVEEEEQEEEAPPQRLKSVWAIEPYVPERRNFAVVGDDEEPVGVQSLTAESTGWKAVPASRLEAAAREERGREAATFRVGEEYPFEIPSDGELWEGKWREGGE